MLSCNRCRDLRRHISRFFRTFWGSFSAVSSRFLWANMRLAVFEGSTRFAHFSPLQTRKFWKTSSRYQRKICTSSSLSFRRDFWNCLSPPRVKKKLNPWGGWKLNKIEELWRDRSRSVCGVESELSSKTEGIGVPPALEKETGKGNNRIWQVLFIENAKKNPRKERRVPNEKARTTEQTNPANGRQKLQSDQASRIQSLKD